MQNIRVVPSEPTRLGEGQIPIWEPTIGSEFNSYGEKTKPAHRLRLRSECPRILSACVKPGESRANAGLVLGYVQSGKTSSFTGVAALARDNGYSCIVVIGGTSVPLLRQTEERLKSDLEIASTDVALRWLYSMNPKLGERDGDAIIARLRYFGDAIRAGRRGDLGVPLIAVMKNRTHLQNLCTLFADLAGSNRLGLGDLTTLIIDDEAHMHGPNISKNQDIASPIYTLIRELRGYFPSHTLLQYTATPQANLLAALDDEFSPDFVRLLGVGEGYAGGRRFFLEEHGNIIREIPAGERINAMQDGNDRETPESLLHAFATFLLICADGHVQSRLNYSFLTHVSGKNSDQDLAAGWMSALRASWQTTLRAEHYDADRADLIARYFRPAHADLAQTADPPLLPLDALLPILVEILGQVQIQTISQTGGSEVNWGLSPYNVINGGNLLGVGFTVKGLVVTHMMRSPGGGQSDTIQQRGRFFGYHGDNLNRTRVWLEEYLRDHFANYVDQEEYLRKDLSEFDSNNISLRGWKRRFRLDKNAKLCRKNAIRLDLFRFRTEERWIFQNNWIDDPRIVMRNRELIDDFLSGTGEFQSPIQLRRTSIGGSGQTEATRHEAGSCSLEKLRVLLASYVVHESNRMSFEVVRSLIDEYEDSPEFGTVDVFRMGDKDKRRRRDVEAGGKISVTQGGNTSKGYQGDRSVRNEKTITLQIYRLDHGDANNIQEYDVCYLGISLPAELDETAQNWVHQE